MLKAKQQQVYDFIVEHISLHGYPPSVREIGQAVGLSSPSTVHAHLKSLEKAGLIEKSAGQRRAISLKDREYLPEQVPILGAVTAGAPILAVEDALGYLQYTPEEGGEHFALKIRGDSMIGAGILDGDMVVVRRQAAAEERDIVIALIGEEATCKRLRHVNGQVWLMPENKDYDPIDGRDARILGKVTAVIRKY